METTNLYFKHDTDMFGDAIIMLYATDKAFYELSKEDEQNAFIGKLDSEDADNMEKLNIDCSDELKCINYARDIKGYAIPEHFKIITES